ncbi:hypothetical protein BDY19DRAFT_1046768 [Irpex rosettiformis]|uniref:Uncharacterized protein n=1 Tax=Irpex rosettiformis TaxID=378272 RepID=A0ACB8U9Y0_9APHY|nr:hypothetical protein BDY19DRAFT_1046768 [Irpex rosettiformis]
MGGRRWEVVGRRQMAVSLACCVGVSVSVEREVVVESLRQCFSGMGGCRWEVFGVATAVGGTTEGMEGSRANNGKRKEVDERLDVSAQKEEGVCGWVPWETVLNRPSKEPADKHSTTKPFTPTGARLLQTTVKDICKKCEENAVKRSYERMQYLQEFILEQPGYVRETGHVAGIGEARDENNGEASRVPEYGRTRKLPYQIVSIDGKRVSDSPDLCLKLFDDRFQPKECPNEYDEATREADIERYNRMVRYYMPWRKPEDSKVDDDYDSEYRDYFISAKHADQLAMTEAAAYDKLRSVQGSFIPWFYGVYTFTLPDGTHLYGLLMEYIEGTKLHSGADVQDPEISADRQITLIKSCRHGARVLDIADIAQHDWHQGQVLLYTNPTSKIDHAIFIDFASTSQTYSVDNMVLTDNYINLFMVLSGRCGSVWLDEELVWDNYGEPDDSDPVVAFLHRGKQPITIEAREKFTFITAV